MKRFLVVFAVVVTVVFVGCDTGSGSGAGDRLFQMSLDSLDGTWVSTWYEIFEINASARTFNFDGGFVGYGFDSKVHEVWGFTAARTSGLIFIEYTSKGDLWETTSSGNFTAVYFDTLTASSVEIANAAMEAEPDVYKTPTFSNLASAKTAFTIHTVDTYFAMTSACDKQP